MGRALLGGFKYAFAVESYCDFRVNDDDTPCSLVDSNDFVTVLVCCIEWNDWIVSVHGITNTNSSLRSGEIVYADGPSKCDI